MYIICLYKKTCNRCPDNATGSKSSCSCEKVQSDFPPSCHGAISPYRPQQTGQVMALHALLAGCFHLRTKLSAVLYCTTDFLRCLWILAILNRAPFSLSSREYWPSKETGRPAEMAAGVLPQIYRTDTCVTVRCPHLQRSRERVQPWPGRLISNLACVIWAE